MKHSSGVHRINTTISIITVCLNSESTIKDTLDCIDSQEGVSIEHLIIDGGSSDGTLRILQDHFKPWRKVITSKDDGIYDAMNRGIRMASGDVIGFLNSDDFYVHQNVLKTILTCFESSPLDGCYGDLVFVKKQKKDQITRRWKSGPCNPKKLSSGWIPPHPALFLRATVFNKYGLFNTSYKIAADYEFMVRIIYCYRVKLMYIPETIVKMRLGGVSTRSFIHIIRQNLEILSVVRQYNLSDSLVKFMLRKIIRKLKQCTFP